MTKRADNSYERLPATAIAMMMSASPAHGERHQETSRGADRDDAREQEHHAQATKHIRLLVVSIVLAVSID